MIEDIILEHDRRGIAELRKFLSSNFCERAAKFLYAHMEAVLICTGFYVAGFCETDGPVGSIMLGEALMSMGSEVSVVTDKQCYEVLEKAQVPFDIYTYPISEEKESLEFGENLISTVDPSILVSIERCGRAKDGRYYNMKGEDISKHTAKIDCLVDSIFPHTIGIGDGGNEIGMGNLYDEVKKVVVNGEKIASVVKTTHLVISSVSNWGAYGLLAYLSAFEGKNLLESEDRILGNVIKAGAIDSLSKKSELAVDGIPLQTTNAVLRALRTHIGLENAL